MQNFTRQSILERRTRDFVAGCVSAGLPAREMLSVGGANVQCSDMLATKTSTTIVAHRRLRMPHALFASFIYAGTEHRARGTFIIIIRLRRTFTVSTLSLCIALFCIVLFIRHREILWRVFPFRSIRIIVCIHFKRISMLSGVWMCNGSHTTSHPYEEEECIVIQHQQTKRRRHKKTRQIEQTDRIFFCHVNRYCCRAFTHRNAHPKRMKSAIFNYILHRVQRILFHVEEKVHLSHCTTLQRPGDNAPFSNYIKLRNGVAVRMACNEFA